MALATKYRAEFDDTHGKTWCVDFLEDAWGGAVTDLVPTDNPINFFWDENITNSIMKSEVEVQVYSETNFALVDLYSQADKHFRVYIYDAEYHTSVAHMLADHIYWRGYIKPRYYQEAYEPPPYPVTILCTDGLDLLETTLYTQYDQGRRQESQIILDILATVEDTSFYEYINIYEDTMNNGVGDSPLNQVQPDSYLFKDMYQDEVLEAILLKYNAYIVQYLGYFRLLRPVEMVGATEYGMFGATVYGRYFTAVDTTAPVSFTPLQYISRTATHITNRRQVPGGVKMIQPTAKKITLHQDYGNRESWLNNYEFTADKCDIDTDAFTNWTNDAGIVAKHISEFLVKETNGVGINAGTGGTYMKQVITPQISISITDKFVIELDYNWWNDTAAPVAATSISMIIKQGARYLTIQDDTEAVWGGIAALFSYSPTNIYGVANIPVGFGDGWMHFKREFYGLESTSDIEVVLATNGFANAYNCFRNIELYTSSYEIKQKQIRRRFKERLAYLGDIFRLKSKYYTVDVKEDKELVVENVISPVCTPTEGVELTYDYILGDVRNVDNNNYIDNVLGQFKGSLAVLHRDTLTEAAADFVTDHDADYPNLDVTSAGDDIIFTSKTAGNDFTGNTTITNTDGDLAGDVDYTQENVVAQAQIDTITVLGTDGTANVTCDTWTKLATWNGTIAQTLQDFVDAWEAFYTTKGISLTNTATELIFEANTPGDPLTPLTSIVTVSGNLRGTVVVTQANIVGQKRIDTITLTGTSGTANILCDAVTKEVDIDEVITNSATWSTRAVGGESLPLLELIGDEIANQTSRTRDLIQMPIIETTEALQMNYIGCFVDDLNQYSGVDRAFVMSRGSFNVKYRLWIIDLMEILPTMAESGYTVDTTVITVDNTLITVDQI